jgi:hypothetical protein
MLRLTARAVIVLKHPPPNPPRAFTLQGPTEIRFHFSPFLPSGKERYITAEAAYVMVTGTFVADDDDGTVSLVFSCGTQQVVVTTTYPRRCCTSYLSRCTLLLFVYTTVGQFFCGFLPP